MGVRDYDFMALCDLLIPQALLPSTLYQDGDIETAEIHLDTLTIIYFQYVFAAVTEFLLSGSWIGDCLAEHQSLGDCYYG